MAHGNPKGTGVRQIAIMYVHLGSPLSTSKLYHFRSLSVTEIPRDFCFHNPKYFLEFAKPRTGRPALGAARYQPCDRVDLKGFAGPL